MDINEMWELLETEPTRDKREIKRAYARAVKKYHPEENPEAFQKVYSAYKQAVDLAGKPEKIFSFSGEGRRHTEEPQGEEIFRFEIHIDQKQQQGQEEPPEEQQEPEGESEEEKRIHKLFLEMKEKREKEFSIFRQKWHWYLANQEKDGAQKEMRSYMKTHWFLDIMEEPAVISQLAAGFDRYCRAKSGALKEDIWQLYSLENPKSQEDKSRRVLFHVLAADIERSRIRQLQESVMRKRMIQSEKNKKIKARLNLGMHIVVFLGIISFCIGVAVLPQGGFGRKNFSQKEEQEEIFSYMQENYPMADFAWPKPYVEETEARYVDADVSGRNYRVEEKNFGITAFVYTLQKDGKIYIGEDFGRQYMRQLGEKQGLICDLCRVEEPWTDGKTHNLMLGGYEISPDLSILKGELQEYMERFREFAESPEVREFVNIEGVSFCVSNCFCPKAFIMEAGGVPKPLLYDLKELPEPEVMAEDMAECITDYYIHMEPWQLEHDPLYEQWLSSYEEKVKEMDTEPSTPPGKAVAARAEELGVQAVIYPYGEIERISLGDLYRMTKKSDYPPSVYKDGSGFLWKNGKKCVYDESGDDRGSEFTCDIILEMFAED